MANFRGRDLSPRALLDTGLVSNVIDALARHGVPPQLLTLEITEGSVMADPEKAIAVLHALRAAGIRLSVDDFGTGYSSLSYLKRLPVQEVKIDRSFLVDVLKNTHEVPIGARSLICGINLGQDVVAEGIETTRSGVGCRSSAARSAGLRHCATMRVEVCRPGSITMPGTLLSHCTGPERLRRSIATRTQVRAFRASDREVGVSALETRVDLIARRPTTGGCGCTG